MGRWVPLGVLLWENSVDEKLMRYRYMYVINVILINYSQKDAQKVSKIMIYR